MLFVTKVCRGCGTDKPRDAYPARGGARCSACVAAYQREYVRNRKEKDPDFAARLARQAARWRADNVVERQVYARAAYLRSKAEHPEAHEARAAAWKAGKAARVAARAEREDLERMLR